MQVKVQTMDPAKVVEDLPANNGFRGKTVGNGVWLVENENRNARTLNMFRASFVSP